MGDHVVLVGMMGSGKSTVGRIVAERMRRPFSTTATRRSRGGPARASRRSSPKGASAAFVPRSGRRSATALASPVPSVIAVAGGAVLDPETRRRLRFERRGRLARRRPPPPRGPRRRRTGGALFSRRSGRARSAVSTPSGAPCTASSRTMSSRPGRRRAHGRSPRTCRAVRPGTRSSAAASRRAERP